MLQELFSAATRKTIHVQGKQHMYKENNTWTRKTTHRQREQYMYKENNTWTRRTIQVQGKQRMYKENNTCTRKTTLHTARNASSPVIFQCCLPDGTPSHTF